MWIGGGDGYVYYIQDPAESEYAKALGTVTVNADIEFAPVPIGSDRGGRGQPRYLKLNATAAIASTWTVVLTIMSDSEGNIIDTQIFTVTIGADETSVITPIPPIARGNWCKVRLQHNGATGGGTFKSVLLYYIPRYDFEGERAA